MPQIILKRLSKNYGAHFVALDKLSLEIEDGSLTVLAGSSGAGKSTLLRLIAGLEEADSGEVIIGGKNTAGMSVKERNIAMMFQSDTLRGNKTVFENIAVGLVLRNLDTQTINARVNAAAQLVGIENLLEQKVEKLDILSRKLTDLARIAARAPELVLLDSPLVGLDEKERAIVKTNILKLHKNLGVTFVYAASDATEALTVGDKITLLKDGRILAYDAPQVLYDNPVDIFAAAFLGLPQMNFFDAQLSLQGADIVVQFGKYKIKLPPARARRIVNPAYIGGKVILGIRPEDIHDEEVFITGSPDTLIEGTIELVERFGSETVLHLKIEGKSDYAAARVNARSNFKQGEKITLALDAKRIYLFDAACGHAVMGVPEKNLLKAELRDDKGLLLIDSPFTKFELPKGISSRLCAALDKVKNVLLEFSPSALMDKESYDTAPFGAESKKRFFVMEASVAFTEKYPSYTAVYASAEGIDGFAVSLFPADSNITGGEKVKLYCRFADLEVIDADSGEKVFAFKNIGENTVEANVAVSGAKARAAFGKTTLSLNAAQFTQGSGRYSLQFAPDAFTLAQNSKSGLTIKCEVSDADFLGRRTVVYAKADGFADYLSAIISGSFSQEIGDKIFFTVNPEKMTAKKL